MLTMNQCLDIYRKLLSDTNDDEFIKIARQLCRTDLFFLLTQVCKRQDLIHEWYYQRCKEVEANPDGYLDLWSRAHGKSSIITFGLTLQDILKNPEARIAIISHTRGVAKRFLSQIKNELEKNVILKKIFPDILYERPETESVRWSEDVGIIVKRKGNPKEATIYAAGIVEGMPTGAHFTHIIYDDLVTEVSVSTPEQIDKTLQCWELSLNLAEPSTKIRYIGTKYHYNDLYTTILDRQSAIPRIRVGIIKGEPLLWSKEYMEERRRDLGPYTFACLTGDTLITMADFTFKKMKDVQVGDEVVGWDRNDRNDAYLKPAKVLAVQSRKAETVESTLESGNKVKHTPNHLWWTGRPDWRGRKEYSELGFRQNAQKQLCQLVDVNKINRELSVEDIYYAGYVAGFLDADGSITGNTAHFYQGMDRNKYIYDFLRSAQDRLHIDTNLFLDKRESGVDKADVYLVGGREEKISLLCLCPRFAKREKLIETIYNQGTGYFGKGSVDKLVSQEPIGIQTVWSIQTETGNYFANGYASKNSQVLLDPAAEQNAIFKESWLRYYGRKEGTGKYNKYIIVDPANTKNKRSDYTAIVVIGVGADQNYYVLDIIRDKLSLTERTDILFSLYQEYHPLKVGYESYGKDADIDHILYRQKQEQFRFEIQPLKGNMAKKDRIGKLVPLFEQGRIYLPYDREIIHKNWEGRDYYPTKLFVDGEYLTFPFCSHDDILDVLSRIVDPDMGIKFPFGREYQKLGHGKPEYTPKYNLFAR